MGLFTLKKKEVNYARTDKEFSQLATDAIKEIEKFIADNDLVLNEKSKRGFDTFKRICRLGKWEIHFQNKSKNRKKKLNKYVGRFRKKKSIASANRLLWFLRNRILSKEGTETVTSSWGGIYTKNVVTMPDFDAVKILPPLKEQLIQEKRKKWKEAQLIADQLLTEYKEEKGDYYKKRGC
jgi:hypothetical protein